MNAADILHALNQRPFKPFRLVLSTGREIPILQSDTVLLNEPRTTLLAVEGERFHVVDLQHIAQLTSGGQPTAEQLAT
jgi:Na+-transporting NADH:ubiquinone oxidoreductase subunit NqrA